MSDKGLSRGKWIAAVVVAAAVAVYTAFCHFTGLMPRCIFKWLTGYDCPGCGSQRALRALAHGQVMEAWSYNYLLPFLVAYLAALLLLPLWRGNRGVARVYAALTSPAAVWSVAAAVVVWWILRNIK